jgi:cyanophycinase
MTGSMRYGNRVVARWSSLAVVPSRFVRRRIAASLASLLLGFMPVMAAEKVDAPATSTPSKEVVGTLVIVGGGGMPDAIRDCFFELAGGRKGKLVVIPTASELEDATRVYHSYNYWKKQGLASVEMLNTLDRKRANDPDFIKPLTEATAVWLGGGDQSRLANAYRGTAVERELRRLLAHGGVIGGTSAGASVMSSIMITGGNPQARVGEGFGFLPDVVIDQHFQNRRRLQRLLGVLEKHPRCLGLGIDEATAVVVRGHSFTVVGKANVSVCLPSADNDKDNVRVLKSGDAGDLVDLSRKVLARLKTPPASKSAASNSRASAP